MNGAMNFLATAAAPCAVFRRHLLRMLRPEGPELESGAKTAWNRDDFLSK